MLVSIIIPVYNVEQYIEKCLDSVLGQTYRELDVICINDGSTDNSLAVLLRYEAQDSRVRIIDKENGGVVSAREAGLRIAKGEYTTFVDADDWIEADAIECMLAANQPYGADIIACGIWRDKGSSSVYDGNLLRAGFYTREYLVKHPDDWLFSTQYLCKPLGASLCTKLFRTELIQRMHALLPRELVYEEDWTACILCCAHCSGLLVLDRAFYHYVYRWGSAASGKRRYSEENYRAMYRVLSAIVERDEGRLRCLTACMHHALMEQFFSEYRAYGVLFPFTKVREGQRILLYGAGTFGRVVHGAVCESSSLTLAGWTDLCWDSEELAELSLDPLEVVVQGDYDMLVITLLDEMRARKIAEELNDKGVPYEHMDFMRYEVLENVPLPLWLSEGEDGVFS